MTEQELAEQLYEAACTERSSKGNPREVCSGFHTLIVNAQDFYLSIARKAKELEASKIKELEAASGVMFELFQHLPAEIQAKAPKNLLECGAFALKTFAEMKEKAERLEKEVEQLKKQLEGKNGQGS